MKMSYVNIQKDALQISWMTIVYAIISLILVYIFRAPVITLLSWITQQLISGASLLIGLGFWGLIILIIGGITWYIIKH